MAATRNRKRPASRKAAAQPKKSATKQTAPRVPAARATSTAPSRAAEPGVQKVVRPAADPALADARDRAADVLALAADRARELSTHGEARAEQLLDRARQQAAIIRRAAETDAHQILHEVAEEAGRRLHESTQTADQTRRAAHTTAQDLRATAGREVDELLARANTEAEQIREAARTDSELLYQQAQQTAERLRRGAEEAAAALRGEADNVLADVRSTSRQRIEEAETAAARTREQAEARAAQIIEDADRDRQAARQEAERVRRLVEEDCGRQRKVAGEDAERLTRTAREEADRLLAAARATADAERKQAGEELAKVCAQQESADLARQQADSQLATAQQAMRKATSRTEQRLERQRLRRKARQEQRAACEERREKARGEREGRRAGRPTASQRLGAVGRNAVRRMMIVGPITAPMAVAWTGQAGFAEDILGWVMPFTILFAAAWELSTAFVGWMYHQARSNGDAGTLYRVSTWIFACGAAVMNFWHASGQVAGRTFDPVAGKWVQEITYWHMTPKAVAFAAMSIVGMVLWELYASLIHRRKLRADGRVAKARPSIGVVRWLRYPRHSFTAWSLAITDASLTTLDRAWAAAGREITDRKAVRSGRTISRLVVARPRTAQHGPADIPAFLTLTRTDRSGPESPALPVHTDPGTALPGLAGPDHGGPDAGTAVRTPVRPAPGPDRMAGPDRALAAASSDRTGPDLRTDAGPDRTARTLAAHQPVPARRGVTARTAPAADIPHGADRTARQQPDRTGGPDYAPDRTVITLTDLERTALDRLRTEDRALNRANIARAVRTEGGSIATDRAGQIAVALKQHAVR